eukprot:211341_1
MEPVNISFDAISASHSRRVRADTFRSKINSEEFCVKKFVSFRSDIFERSKRLALCVEFELDMIEFVSSSDRLTRPPYVSAVRLFTLFWKLLNERNIVHFPSSNESSEIIDRMR